jgi:hypothetical protein
MTRVRADPAQIAAIRDALAVMQNELDPIAQAYRVACVQLDVQVDQAVREAQARVSRHAAARQNSQDDESDERMDADRAAIEAAEREAQAEYERVCQLAQRYKVARDIALATLDVVQQIPSRGGKKAHIALGLLLDALNAYMGRNFRSQRTASAGATQVSARSTVEPERSSVPSSLGAGRADGAQPGGDTTDRAAPGASGELPIDDGTTVTVVSSHARASALLAQREQARQSTHIQQNAVGSSSVEGTRANSNQSSDLGGESTSAHDTALDSMQQSTDEDAHGTADTAFGSEAQRHTTHAESRQADAMRAQASEHMQPGAEVVAQRSAFVQQYAASYEGEAGAEQLYEAFHARLTELAAFAQRPDGTPLNEHEQGEYVAAGIQQALTVSGIPNAASMLETYSHENATTNQMLGTELQLDYLTHQVRNGVVFEGVEYTRYTPANAARRRFGDIDVVMRSNGQRIAVELKNYSALSNADFASHFLQVNRNIFAAEIVGGVDVPAFDEVHLVYSTIDLTENMYASLQEHLNQARTQAEARNGMHGSPMRVRVFFLDLSEGGQGPAVAGIVQRMEGIRRSTLSEFSPYP